MELEGVADEVLQELAHLRPVGLDGGQIPHLHGAAGLLQAGLQVGEDLGHHLGEVHRLEGVGLGRHAREGEQVLDKALHPDRRPLHPAQVAEPLLAQGVGVLVPQPLPEDGDLP